MLLSEAIAHFFYDHYLKKDLRSGSINDSTEKTKIFI